MGFGRPPKQPLRSLTEEERSTLGRIARSNSEPADRVARAKILLAVANGASFTQAAQTVGRRSNDAVAALVARFNDDGLAALKRRHGGGAVVRYGAREKERILREFRRTPDREQDGTATWSLTTLKKALRKATDGLVKVSTWTILRVLHEAGYTWQADRTWCETGTVQRKRKDGIVEVTDPETERKRGVIEHAYRHSEALGIPLWCQDEAGPYQAIPQPGRSWQREAHPARRPHEYVRGGTAKILTLFHPKTGLVRVEPVETATNAVLHPWLKRELSVILAGLPSLDAIDPQAPGRQWDEWGWEEAMLPRLGLRSFEELPPVRMGLIWDNLAGHRTPEMVRWCLEAGVAPIYTPLGGSWLNLAESIQRILVRRALEGCHPESSKELMEWLSQTARGWNRDPTPFCWGGKRAERRQRARERRHALGGSNGYTLRPIARNHWAPLSDRRLRDLATLPSASLGLLANLTDPGGTAPLATAPTPWSLIGSPIGITDDSIGIPLSPDRPILCLSP